MWGSSPAAALLWNETCGSRHRVACAYSNCILCRHRRDMSFQGGMNSVHEGQARV
jgi:hypothetical protein